MPGRGVTSRLKDPVDDVTDAREGVPVIVIGTFWLSGAVLAAATVTVKLSPGMMGVGVIVAVVPAGSPLTARSRA